MIGPGSPFWIAASSSSFSPGDLGSVLSHADGDHVSNSLDTSVIYDDMHGAGTLGGTWDAGTNEQPVAVAVGSRNAPVFRGGRHFDSSLAASAWDVFNNTTSNVSITIRAYLYEAEDGAVYFGTKSTAAGEAGLLLYQDGTVLDARFSDGTTNTDLTSTVTLADETWHTIQATKDSSGNVALTVDGETLVTGSFTPADATPSQAAHIGNNDAGTAPANALICEVVVHGVELDAAGLAQMRSYVTAKWSATPDFSYHAYGNVVAHYYAGAGISEATGVSAVRDLSGYNNDLAQADTAKQPTLVSSWRNGEAGIQGDGVDDILGIAAFNQGDIAQDNTIFMAAESSSSGYFYSGAAAGFENALAHWFQYAGAVNSVSTASNTPILTSCMYSGASSTVRIERDGLSVITDTGNAGTFGMRGFSLCARTSGSQWTSATIAEVIVYDSDVTASNTEILAALSAKYDIEAVA